MTTQQTYNYNSSLVYDFNNIFSLYTPIGTVTNANIYVDSYKTFPTNYVIFLNVSNYNAFFSTKYYEDFTNQVNQNILVNKAYLQSILNSPNSSVIFRGLYGQNENIFGLENITNTNGIYTSNRQHFGFRLLEIAALNIFGSATARAAVSNDTDFIYGTGTNLYSGSGETSGVGTLYSALTNQINYAFNVESNNIFNQYVDTWRYKNSNDVNRYQEYNFDNTNFQLYMTYQVNTYGVNRGYGYTDSIADLYPSGFVKSILVVITDQYNIEDIINKYNILV